MFEKLNNLETELIRGEEIKNLLEILAIDYFDKIENNDALIVYNYKNFHEKYGSLLNLTIEEFNRMINGIQKNFDELWSDYQESREVTNNGRSLEKHS